MAWFIDGSMHTWLRWIPHVTTTMLTHSTHLWWQILYWWCCIALAFLRFEYTADMWFSFHNPKGKFFLDWISVIKLVTSWLLVTTKEGVYACSEAANLCRLGFPLFTESLSLVYVCIVYTIIWFAVPNCYSKLRSMHCHFRCIYGERNAHLVQPTQHKVVFKASYYTE